MAADNSATVIVANLDDSELRKSIESLVSTVNTSTQQMATSFNTYIQSMTEALRQLSGAQRAATDETKRASEQRKATYDNEAEAAALTVKRLRGNLKDATNAQNPMVVGSPELQAQNELVGQLKTQLKDALMTEEERRKAIERQNEALERQKAKQLKAQQQPYTYDYNKAMQLSTNSLTQAHAKLKELEDVQRRMKASGLFDEVKLRRVEKDIDNLRAKIERLRSKKPMTMKDVLGMDESSVEAITRKMSELKKVQIDPKSTAQVRDLGNEYQRLSRLQSEMLGKNIQATHSNNMLAQSFGYIRNRIVYALTLGELTNFVKQIYEIRGQYELLERSLGVLVGSFQRGSQVFRELNEMAIRSPFTLIELGTAAKQLTAYNFAADEVVNTTRRLADISAALGVPMERLTYNLGQIRAQTVLTARDARDFANAGLPIVKELADYYTLLEGRVVSTGDVYDRMSKKMVSYNDVMVVLNKLTDEGGKFFDFQAKQADTLRVQIANLSLAWNNMLNDIGSSHQGLLTLPLRALRALFQNWKSLDNIIWDVITAIGVYKGLSVVYAIHANRIGMVSMKMKGLYQGGVNLIEVFKKIGTSIKDAFTNKANWVTLLAVALMDVGWTAWEAHKSIVALNDEIKKSAEESSKNFEKFAETYSEVRNALNPQNGKKGGGLSVENANKAWEAMKEEIKASSSASDTFITKLESINDISTRLRAGFNLMDRMREVDSMLQTLDKTAIEVRGNWAKWWNLWIAPEGLKTNIDDYIQALKEGASSTYAAYETMFSDLRSTVRDMYENFQLLDPDQQRYAFEKTLNSIAQQEKMGVEEYRIMRMNAERIYADFAQGEVKKEFSNRKAEQEIFFRWLNETHSSELQKRLGNMTAEEIKHGAWLVGENGKWVERMTREFSKQYGVSFDDLYSYVKLANTWSVYIPVVFGSKDKEKSIYETLTEADSNLETAKKKRERLQKYLSKLDDEGKKSTEEYTKAQNELTTATEDYNKALKEGGELKKSKSSGAKKDPLGESLTKEIQLITDIQKRYNDYRQMGVDAQTAIQKATEEYGNTLIRTNATLKKYGVKTLSSEELANMPLQQIRDFYREQLRVANELGNTKGVEALEKALANINVEITKIDYKKITDGLNSELSKLKEEYELAVELDANPELSNVFMDMMGISADELQSLPHTAKEVAERAQEAINSVFKKYNVNKVFDLESNLNRANFEAWVDANGQQLKDGMVTQLKSIVDLVNKTRLDETKKQVQEWDKLLEKYAEYETKRKRIIDETEREMEVARQRGAGADVMNAIARRGNQKLADEKFEQFQKSAYWITATGDLSSLSSSALDILINKLEEYKRSAKNLDPKKIMELNRTLRRVRNEIKKSNPFSALSIAIEESKSAQEQFMVDLKDTETQIDDMYQKWVGQGFFLSDEDVERLNALKKRAWELRQAIEATSNVSFKTVINGVSQYTSKAQELANAFKNISDAVGDEDLSKAAEITGDIVGNFAAAEQGAEAWGGWWGAIIGGVTDLIPKIVKWVKASDDSIEKIEANKQAIEELQSAYKNLDYIIQDAYGSQIDGAKRAIIYNKQLELQELERQLALEKGRRAKDQSRDTIRELEEQIAELRNEVRTSINDITNDLLGMSDVNSAAETMVSSMIDAFKNGEDYMKVYEDSFEKMVDNMIMKAVVAKIIGERVQAIFDLVQDAANERADSDPAVKLAKKNVRELEMALKAQEEADDDWTVNMGGKTWTKNEVIANTKQLLIEANKALADAYAKASIPSVEDIQQVSGKWDDWRGEDDKAFKAYMDLLGVKYGENAKGNNLSALQQGIQGITEDTAGALEAYMNSVSQQVYLHSSLLTQIRDYVQEINTDASLGTMSEMLLQLQQSYQIQVSIQNTLSGWSNASGMAVRVEMI